MITDQISHINKYRHVCSNLGVVIDFINMNDLHTLEVGTYPIKGDGVYAVVSINKTVSLENTVWEVHKNHIDVQCIVDGGEGIGVSVADKLVPTTTYDPVKDIQLFKGKGPVKYIAPGEFMLLFEREAHASKVAVKNSGLTKKVLFKIKT